MAELWARLQKASRNEREHIINSLDKATLERLRTETNPYKKPVYNGASKQHRMLGFYTIPLNEKYAGRFAMTSLIGFIYRMLDEYEPPTEYISEKDYDFSKKFEVLAKALEYKLTCEKYDNLIAEASATSSEENETEIIANKIKKQKYIMSKNYDVNKEAVLTEEYKKLKPLYKNARELMYEEVDLSPEQVEELHNQVKKELNISITAEEHYADLRDTIQAFLDLYLRYNPDEHVRAAYKPNYEDPKRRLINVAKETAPELTILPPDDTFARWNRYTEANYECLRQATDDIYCEKADFEFAIAPLEVFSGPTKEEAMEKYEVFKTKYANELEVELRAVDFGNWSLLGPWQQNREVMDFYNENTELLKRIIEQAKEDSRVGQKLMTKRTKKEKKKSPEPLPEGYTAPTELTGLGVRHADDIKMANIIPDEIPYDPEEPSMAAIEVNVHHIKPTYDRKQRHIRSKINQWKFNTNAHKLGEQDVSGYVPAQYHKQQEAEGNYAH